VRAIADISDDRHAAALALIDELISLGSSRQGIFPEVLPQPEQPLQPLSAV
jgi:hypothetical protein